MLDLTPAIMVRVGKRMNPDVLQVLKSLANGWAMDGRSMDDI